MYPAPPSIGLSGGKPNGVTDEPAGKVNNDSEPAGFPASTWIFESGKQRGKLEPCLHDTYRR